MRGDDTQQSTMFSFLSPEERVPASHPLRPIRILVDRVLQRLNRRFEEMYATTGRPSIAPEKLLRARLLQILYSVRSERMLMEQLAYNLLFRWFVGLNMDEEVWVPTVFSKNRDRLLAGEVAEAFLDEVLAEAKDLDLLSAEHFTVDGTLIEAWAGLKSFQRKDGSGPGPSDTDRGNPTVDFHGETRRNDSHASTTDGEARLARQGDGKESKLCYGAHGLMENRNGLVVHTRVTLATGTSEREASIEMVEEIPGGSVVTLGADKGYDTKDHVAQLRERNVTPHVAQKKHSAIDARTTRHAGYKVSQQKRKRVEEIFGWLKTVGMLRKTRHKGLRRGGWVFAFAASAYNLVRVRNLLSVLPAAVA
ncbi:MAG TPA: IS5 family transposase [Candidatus Sulfotelmatobacter sp.]